MLKNIQLLYHASIKISKQKIIYIDPFKIKESYKDADIIFITHNHYDHYSPEDIEKIKKENTKIVMPKEMASQITKNYFKDENIMTVEPNKKYEIEEIKFETIPAYNTNKTFHPEEKKWVGYILEIDRTKYYIAGDTDITEENKKVKCDVAFVPVGGTYTMDYKEAANLINIIKPKIVVPIHYGSIVGTDEDAEGFSKLVQKDITVLKL